MPAPDVLPLDAVYLDLNEWLADEQLLAAVEQCIGVERDAASAAMQEFKSNEHALELVAPEALQTILQNGEDIHGLTNDNDISNAIVFSFKALDRSVISDPVREVRAELDQIVERRFRETFQVDVPITVRNSGQFWYPPGGFMSWHTNNRFPGWRIYVTHAEEPGKSFFRYRHPEPGEIVTSSDSNWNVRMFRVDARRPLWHCVYSETHRHSFGFVVRPRHWFGKWKDRVRRLLGRS